MAGDLNSRRPAENSKSWPRPTQNGRRHNHTMTPVNQEAQSKCLVRFADPISSPASPSTRPTLKNDVLMYYYPEKGIDETVTRSS